MDETDELVAMAAAVNIAPDDDGDNRPNVYWDDEVGKRIYRASALGNCIRALILDQRGFVQSEPPDMIKAAWERGRHFEQPVIQRFREEYGFTVVDDLSLEQYGELQWNGQIETELPVGTEKVVRCHPDGIVQCYRSNEALRRLGIEVGDRYVLEVKAFSESMYASYKSKGLMGFPFYSWQFAVEMITTGLPGAYVVGVKTEDQQGIQFIDVKFYDTPPHSKLDVVKRVMAIDRGAQEADAGEGMPNADRCEWAQWPCGHWSTHLSEGVWAGKTGSGEAVDDAGETVERAEDGYRGEFAYVNPNSEEFDKNDPEVKLQQAIFNLNQAATMRKKYADEEKLLKEQLRIQLISAYGGKKGDYWKLGKYNVLVKGRAGTKKVSEEKVKEAGLTMEVVKATQEKMEELMVAGDDTLWVEVKERKDEVE